MAQTPEITTKSTDGLYDFFIVVTPGLELLAEKELRRWLAAPAFSSLLPAGETPEITRDRGGLAIRLPLVAGCELNRVLKIPTRILLRLAIFGCRDFPKLFKKTAGFAWADWVGPNTQVDFQASSHKSRLFIKKRIEETCRDGFKKYKKVAALLPQAQPSKINDGAEPVQDVLVRVQDDVCTVSLDTSGELLHKRGLKVLSSEAPVRETIAAALLTWMTSEDPAVFCDELNKITLVDPMIGSGTFAIEADHLHAANFTRSYAFERFPKFLSEAAGTLRIDTDAKRFRKFTGLDLDVKAAKTTEQNWRDSGANPERLEIKVADVFDSQPLSIDGPKWLITNPPYGERLKIAGRLKDYYELLFESCERLATPDRACFVLPDTAKPLTLRTPRRWKPAKSLRFQNGGLPVTALLFINS